MYDIIRKFSQNLRLRSILSKIIILIPNPLLILLCTRLSRLIKSFNPDLHQHTLRNMIKFMHPSYKLSTIRSYCQDYFKNFILMLVEILFLSPSLKTKMHKIIAAEGKEHLDSALKHGKGAILFSSHTGNIFYYYYYLSQHYPSLVVATAIDEDLHQLYLIFHRMGCQGLDYDTTNKREMLKIIKKHLDSNGIIVLFGDFWRPDFPLSTMFGRPTRTPRGAASLALDLRVPVVPFYGFRIDGLKHKLVFEEAVYLDQLFTRHDKAGAVVFLNSILERFIMFVKPSQWFYWFNIHTRYEFDAEQKSSSLVS